MIRKAVWWIGLGLMVQGQVALASMENCRMERPEDQVLYATDFRWYQPFDAMLQLYEQLYTSGKRLAKRAYWDAEENSYVLPYDADRGGNVRISGEFVGAVRTHIEKALKRKYADAIFFSDMGHSHVFVPEHPRRDYMDLPADRLTEIYEKLFADSEVRFLYHTAEQLSTDGQDPHMVWRRHTRNLVGENRVNGEVFVQPGYHEVGYGINELEGYRWFSAGFHVSANQNGCFVFSANGETRRFDISLYDLTYPDGPVFSTH